MTALLPAPRTPTVVLSFIIGRLWNRLEKWPWRESIQRGLAPVSVGLLFAGWLTVVKGAVTGWITAATALTVFAIPVRSRINPALLILSGAVVGLLALRQA